MKGEYGMSDFGSEHGSADGEGFIPPPPTSPPPYGQPFDVTPSPTDVIGSHDDAPRKSSRLPILLAMATVIVVVLAGGAVALVSKSSTKAGALTKLVPASAYGYIEVNLKQESSAGLYEYLSHFPGSPATKPDAHKATFRDTLLSTVFTKADNIDYTTQIQPWLGNEAGIAVFRGSNGDPVPLVVVATSDAAKAKTDLAQLHQKDTSFAYTVVDGDVLLAQHQADLDSAQTQAAAGALPSSGSYAADVATLPAGSLVTMWADLDRITAAAKSAIAKTCATGSALSGGCSAFKSFSSAGALGALGGKALSGGRVVLGVSVEDKVATVTVRALGQKASSGSVVGDEITTLPADTTGAIAFGNVTGGLTSAMKSLSSLGGLGTLAGLAVAGDAAPAQASAVSMMAAASAPVPAPIPSAMMASLEANPAFASAFPSGFPTAFPSAAVGSAYSSSLSLSMDPSEEISQAFLSATGLKFPDDLGAILGDHAVVAVGDIPLGASHLADLQVGIRSHPKDVAKAQALATTLIDHVSKTGIPFKLGTATAGGDFVLGSSQAYATALAGSGKLGANPQFTAAMGDLSKAHFAAYVDLSKFTGLLAATKEKSLSGFKALGIVERSDGNDQVVQIKLLAG
ncbi:hypothetical protein acdb102_32490 [Acidothermaceae bacterium B102]|nr:hypothetical protein acdb102_32490 [Acidothermaceae bacterium B102]